MRMNDGPLEIRVQAVMIHRRRLLQRDPPVVWSAIIKEIRKAGFSTADICFVLAVNRGALWYWECGDTIPNYEDGRAILRLYATIKEPPQIPPI